AHACSCRSLTKSKQSLTTMEKSSPLTPKSQPRWGHYPILPSQDRTFLRYAMSGGLKLGAKLLDRFFHRWGQVSPPVNNATHRFFDGS
ncbi:MAG: hypothetical protein WAU53_12165, partial [Rhodoplanes sp.]